MTAPLKPCPQVEKIRARFKKCDPSKWDQLESEQIMKDVSVLLYEFDALNRRAVPSRMEALERVAETARRVQAGAKEAFKPHGAVICHIVHDPLAVSLNEQALSLAALDALGEKA